MTHLYMLLHQHRFESGEVDEKLLGIYRSQISGHEAIRRLSVQPGFRDHPDGYVLTPCTVGDFAWSDGFEEPEIGSSQGTVMRLSEMGVEVSEVTYVVYHEFEYPEEVDNIRFIGLFSERVDADRVVEYLQMKPGFREHTDGFTVDTYQLDQDHWTEGFITASPDDFLEA